LSRKGRTRVRAGIMPSRLRVIDGPPESRVKRAIKLVEAGAGDPALGSQIGWLAFRHIINPNQAEAALKFADVAGRYERAMGYPRRSVASPAYERGYIGHGGVGGEEWEQARVDDARTKFEAAHSALVKQGLTAVKMVMAVCVDDQWPNIWLQDDFKAGLTALVEHFRIGKRRA
jgi:hypothetical protein